MHPFYSITFTPSCISVQIFAETAYTLISLKTCYYSEWLYCLCIAASSLCLRVSPYVQHLESCTKWLILYSTNSNNKKNILHSSKYSCCCMKEAWMLHHTGGRREFMKEKIFHSWNARRYYLNIQYSSLTGVLKTLFASQLAGRVIFLLLFFLHFIWVVWSWMMKNNKGTKMSYTEKFFDTCMKMLV